MTLRRTMAYQIAAMVVALLLLSGASLWGLNGLHQDFGSALEGYQDLRSVYEVASRVAIARALLSAPQPDGGAARRELWVAGERFDLFLQHRPGAAASRPTFALPEGSVAGQIRATEQVYARITAIAADIRRLIEQKQRDADAKRRTTMIVMAVLSGALVLAVVAVGVAQYRSVATPLARLSEGVKKVAAARFADRVVPQGHAEFAELAREFNTMAAELDELYRDLEQKVAAKSRELVRSERLASVGFLAAGVAHEINNPLGIITGYAELCLRQLEQRKDEPAAAAEVMQTMRVICEEAFRCKQITEKLLSLAARGEETRSVVSLPEVARHVVSLVAGLPAYRDRKVTLRVDGDEGLRVRASEAEMKQVLLNLTLNALEAVEPGGGEVSIDVSRGDGRVELTVVDNGRGMTPEVLDRAFEPFFTTRKGDSQRGTGLGLSITHAIVQNHGGTLTAASLGPGRGSRFTVQLPAAAEGSAA